MFYGDECPHCENMMPKVEELEGENSVEVEQLEVWNDKENNEKMRDIEGFQECGGVPFFYNTESEEWICGETSTETLENWSNGQEV